MHSGDFFKPSETETLIQTVHFELKSLLNSFMSLMASIWHYVLCIFFFLKHKQRITSHLYNVLCGLGLLFCTFYVAVKPVYYSQCSVKIEITILYSNDQRM